MSIELSKAEIDIFKEMGSIGSGNAATALSQMINKKVVIKPVKTNLVDLEDIPTEIGGAETLVMAVYLRIMGDLTGDAVYLHPKDQAYRIINLLTGKDTSSRIAQEDDISIYKEMSNIFTGSYLNAISSLLNVMIVPSIPHYASDMLGSLIDFLLAEMGAKIDRVFMIKTEMTIDNKDIDGGYLMLFNPDSLEKMMQLVHNKFGI